MSIFWTKNYKVNDIYPDVKTSDLERVAPFPIDNNSGEWGAYAMLRADEQDMGELYKFSMVNILSQFMADLGVSFNTGVSMKEGQIEDKVINRIELVKNEDINEEEMVKEVVEYIVNFYSSDSIKDYEKSVATINMRVTSTEKDLFDKVGGRNNHEKFQNLLEKYFEK